MWKSNKQFIFMILFLFFFALVSGERGKEKGAYKTTPDPESLQFRLGNGLGYINNKWDDAKLTKLAADAGCNGQRKKLPENHFETWGYEIEVEDSKYCNTVGIFDLVGYLHTPTAAHSTNPSNTEKYPPKNLYEPIWNVEGKEVNPNNYWALYIWKTVSIYKPYVKIWEVWNEPDYVGGNWKVVDSWATSPPKSSDLLSWNGSIFEYIRLLRITYEIVKAVDPTAWVATGGLGYPNFMDAILRYSDEPNTGAITDEYPSYGGAYFDCNAYHQYPQYGVTDAETGTKYDGKGSDSLAMKIVTLKKNFDIVMKKHGFDGNKYPKKISVCTETGVASESVKGVVGGDEVRRNFVLKMPLKALEYDVKQVHFFVISDYDGDTAYSKMGDYYNLKDKTPETAVIKPSTQARNSLHKFNIAKMEYNEKKTNEFRETLSKESSVNLTGIVLTNKFKKESETEFYGTVYAVWQVCNDDEGVTPKAIKLSFPYEMKKMDWLGKMEEVGKSGTFEIGHTPLFFMNSKLLKIKVFVNVLFCLLFLA